MAPLCYMKWGSELAWLALANSVVAVTFIVPLGYLFCYHCQLQYYGITNY
jgi:hypothetical protein